VDNHLILFCGLPLTGKTTLSKSISEILGLKRLSMDLLWTEYRLDRNNFEHSKEIFNHLLKRIQSIDNKLVLEGLFIGKERILELKKECDKMGRKLFIIRLTAEDKTLYKRVHHRISNGRNSEGDGEPTINESVIDYFKERYERHVEYDLELKTSD